MRSLLCCLLTCLLTAPLLAQGATPIGSQGATLELGEDWKSQRFERSADGDQFVGRGDLTGCFLLVIEYEALLLEEQDYQRNLAALSQERASIIDSWRTGKPRYQALDGGAFASLSATGSIGGSRIAMDLHLAGKEDLAYFLLVFGPTSKARDLRQEGPRLARSLSLPGEDSAWGRTREPKTHSVRLTGGNTVNLVLPGNYIDRATLEGDPLLSLYSPGTELGAYFLEQEAYTLEGAAEEVLAYFREQHPQFKPHSARPLRIADRPAKETILARGDQALCLWTVEVEQGTYLDLRLEFDYTPEDFVRLRELIREGLSVEEPAQVDAFPQPAPEAEPARSPALQAFLDAGQAVGSLPFVPSLVLEDGQDLLVASHNGVQLLEDGRLPAQPLYEGNLPYWTMAGRQGSQLLVLDGEGQVQEVQRGVLKPTLETGGAFATLGRDGLAYSAPGADLPLGLGNRLWAQTVVVKRGSERRKLTFPGQVTHLAGGLGGQAVLVRVRDDNWQQHLHCITGEEQAANLGPWEAITAVGPATGGWLVTGQPQGQGFGVWLQGPLGPPERLLSGESFVGLTLRNRNDLLLAHVVRDDFQQAEVVAYSMPLSSAQRLGDLGPLHAARHSQLAAQVVAQAKLAPADLATRAGQLALRDAYRAACQEAGIEPPAGQAAIDGLVNDLSGDPALSPEGMAALVALVNGHLLDQGARWVEPASDSPFAYVNSVPGTHGNALAFASVPRDAVVQVGLEDSSWWSPIEMIQDSAQGRELLLGADAASLRQALRATGDQLPDLLASATDDLLALAAAHPENTYLRQRLYGLLAQRQELEAIVRLAAPHAKRPEGDAADASAWLGARVALGEAPMDDLRWAIGHHAETLELYLLLGDLYAQAGPDSHDKARACYAHVEDNAWGPLAERAAAAWEALED